MSSPTPEAQSPPSKKERSPAQKAAFEKARAALQAKREKEKPTNSFKAELPTKAADKLIREILGPQAPARITKSARNKLLTQIFTPTAAQVASVPTEASSALPPPTILASYLTQHAVPPEVAAAIAELTAKASTEEVQKLLNTVSSTPEPPTATSSESSAVPLAPIEEKAQQDTTYINKLEKAVTMAVKGVITTIGHLKKGAPADLGNALNIAASKVLLYKQAAFPELPQVEVSMKGVGTRFSTEKTQTALATIQDIIAQDDPANIKSDIIAAIAAVNRVPQ